MIKVIAGDRIILQPIGYTYALNVSKLTLHDYSDCHEVNSTGSSNCWKAFLFLNSKENKQNVLKGVIRFCKFIYFLINREI